MAGNLSDNNTAGTARRQRSQSEQGERSDAHHTKNVGAVQLRCRSSYRDRFDNRGIVVLRFIDARRESARLALETTFMLEIYVATVLEAKHNDFKTT
jgi:hypothetical protein